MRRKASAFSFAGMAIAFGSNFTTLFERMAMLPSCTNSVMYCAKSKLQLAGSPPLHACSHSPKIQPGRRGSVRGMDFAAASSAGSKSLSSTSVGFIVSKRIVPFVP